MKRTWQFGTVMGWTKAKGQVGQYGPQESIGKALGHSFDGMHFIHLYEDGKLVAVKNVEAVLRAYGVNGPWDANDVAYQRYYLDDKSALANETLERLVLAAINGGENEHSDSN